MTTDEDCFDASPPSVDIFSLLAVSVGGGTDEITVTMVLCAPPDSRAQYRVHLDYTGDFASDGFADCRTTSDDTPKRALRRNSLKDTGPGMINVAGSTLTYVLTYAELGLGLVSGDDVEIWADIQQKGIADRAPDTNDIDSCSKPQTAGEVLQITLD